jgi:hypothetical protein
MLSLPACSTDNSEIWISAYSDGDDFNTASRTILEINDDEVVVSSINFSFRDGDKSFKPSLHVEWEGDSGLVSYFGIKVPLKLFKSGDSLTAFQPNTYPIVYKKLLIKPVNHPLIMEGAYTFNSPLGLDTIEFFADSTFMYHSSYEHKELWEISKYDDYQFLLAGELNTALVPISISMDSIVFKSIFIQERQITFKKIKSGLDNTLLFGSWREEMRINLNGSPPPPISELLIEIRPDTIHFGEEKKPLSYRLNANGKFILFKNSVWKVIQANPDQLVVERHLGFREKDRVFFRRI